MKTEQEIRDEVNRAAAERLAAGDEFAAEFAAKATEFLETLEERYAEIRWDGPRIKHADRMGWPYVTAWFPTLGEWRLAKHGPQRDGLLVDYVPEVRPVDDLVYAPGLPITVGGNWPEENHVDVVYIAQDEYPGDVQFWPEWKGIKE
jgi:hypothetical protein